MITYDPDTPSPFELGTTALYSCDDGYALNGGELQFCLEPSSGENGFWNGSAPVCFG